MKKSSLLFAGSLYACMLSAQPSFQTSLQAGISLPLNSNDIDATHAGKAIHFGNHLDYTFGNKAVRFGLGAYIGYINSISADNKYKETGEAIAEKYRFVTSQLTFNSASFKSTHILLGPVASFGSGKFNINIWAKGGYGLNEPSRYAVIYKEGGIVNNVYINQAGENKNGLAYSAGAGIKLAISQYVGLQLSAGYFSTQTDQVNYNFDREKGTTPKYYTASNQFLQASAGLQFTIGNPGKRNAGSDTGNPTASRMDQKIKTKSNIKNDRVISTGDDNPVASRMDQKIKTKSNIKNDRSANNTGDNTNDDADSDDLLFSPEKIELGTRISDGTNNTQLQSVDNYLTGFVYRTQNGAVLSQCGSNAMPGEPIPGIDVRLKRLGGTGNDILSSRTNKDGSFSFNNIAPGNYTAEAGADKMDITVNGNNENVFKTLDVMGGSCGDTKENYIMLAGDKTYVEVINAREAGSGMATGKKHIGNVKYEDIKVSMGREAGSGLATGRRMHKPYRVADTEFEINPDKIVSSDGKLYAEVITAREAGSGLATGRRSVIVTGDVDGDGFDDYTVVSPRDAASGLPTGKRMHKPFVITKELDAQNNEIAIDESGVHRSIISPRDAASGLPTGKRMHKPFVVTIDEDDDNAIVSPRDLASGQASGRRQYQPLIIRIYPDEDSYEVISPRDAASGLPTGKRMHKPFVITKELGFTEDGDEVVTYRVIHRDLAARNVLLDDDNEKMAIKENAVTGTKEKKKGIITGKDNDTGMANGKFFSKKGYDYYKAKEEDADEAVVSNPLYEQSGTSGVNPLFEQSAAKGENPLYEPSGSQGTNPMYEAKTNLRITGSNGKEHAIFIPENIIVKPGANDAIAPYTTYEVGPVKWMAPESLGGNERKGITEKGIKKNEAASRKGWDGSVKGSGKGINEAGIKVSEDAARKGWDGTVKGGSVAENEAA
ncbi:MAG: hypothetical protein ABJC98_00590, partial [Bacteroidota bacterium]